MLDLASTEISMAKGGYEINPLFVDALEHYPYMVFLIIYGSTFLIYFIYEFADNRHIRGIIRILIVMGFIVSFHNILFFVSLESIIK